jgi:hypothetical protein
MRSLTILGGGSWQIALPRRHPHRLSTEKIRTDRPLRQGCPDVVLSTGYRPRPRAAVFARRPFFVEAWLVKPILILAGISLAAGGLISAWLWVMPADFFVRHPALADTPLQPFMAFLLGGILLLFGVGLLLARGARVTWDYFQNQNS